MDQVFLYWLKTASVRLDDEWHATTGNGAMCVGIEMLTHCLSMFSLVVCSLCVVSCNNGSSFKKTRYSPKTIVALVNRVELLFGRANFVTALVGCWISP